MSGCGWMDVVVLCALGVIHGLNAVLEIYYIIYTHVRLYYMRWYRLNDGHACYLFFRVFITIYNHVVRKIDKYMVCIQIDL